MDRKVIIVGILIVLAGTALGVWQNSQSNLIRNAPKLEEPPIEEQIATQAKCISEGVPPPLPIPIYIQGKPLPSLDFEEVRAFLNGLGYKEVEKSAGGINWYYYTHHDYQEIIHVMVFGQIGKGTTKFDKLASIDFISPSELSNRNSATYEKIISSTGNSEGVTIDSIGFEDTLNSIRTFLRHTPHLYMSPYELAGSIEGEARKAKGDPDYYAYLLGLDTRGIAVADDIRDQQCSLVMVSRGVYNYYFSCSHDMCNRMGIYSYSIEEYSGLVSDNQRASILRRYFNLRPGEKKLQD